MSEDEWVALHLAKAPDFDDEVWRRFARAFGYRGTTPKK